jgi:hypothetical protein
VGAGTQGKQAGFVDALLTQRLAQDQACGGDELRDACLREQAAVLVGRAPNRDAAHDRTDGGAKLAGEEHLLHDLFVGGTNAQEFAEVVRRSHDDRGVEAFIRERLAGKSAAEIEAWSKDFLGCEPDTSQPYYLPVLAIRDQRVPGRDDLTLWADLTDVEEGRPVPAREQVRANRQALGLSAS